MRAGMIPPYALNAPPNTKNGNTPSGNRSIGRKGAIITTINTKLR